MTSKCLFEQAVNTFWQCDVFSENMHAMSLEYSMHDNVSGHVSLLYCIHDKTLLLIAINALMFVWLLLP